MPRTQDLVHVRALLERDRPWAVYALGDLSPPFCHDSEWIVTEEPSPGLALLYRGFGTPVLFLHGDTEALAALLVEIHEPRMYLSIREAALPLVEARWRVSEAQLMARMLLDWSCFRPPPMPGVVRLEPEDLPRLERLYADGVPTGEAPDFFQPSLLEGGVYFGAPEDGGELAAAAGTHLVAPGEHVAAIGNVYTRRDRRGRGLASQVTGGVAAELGRIGIGTVALNVRRSAERTARLYERLGFRAYCLFWEGRAERL